jgi:hypothetical protein
MTLSDLLAGPLPSNETLQGLAVVMSQADAQKIVNYHAWHGRQNLTVYPAALNDGRWMAPADIIPDCITPGGLYFAGFSRLDAGRFSAIELLPVSSLSLADPVLPRLTPEPHP